MGIQLRQSPTGDFLVGTQSGQVPVWNNDTDEWNVSDGSVEASCTQVSGFTTDDITSALASGADEVCFPPGTYEVTGPITQSQAGQVLNFQPGAVLRFAANGLGKLTINGALAAITGTPAARWDATSAVAYVAIDLHGVAASSVGWRFTVNANVAATLIQLSGDHTEVGDIVETGVGAFSILQNIGTQDDVGEVSFVRAGRITFLPVDDGSTTRNFGTIVRYKGRGGWMGGIECNTGGRTIIDMGYDLVGHQWQIDNPEFYAVQANWGMRIRDGAEFGEVWGGIFHQSSDGITARAGSQGIELGEGSVKLYATKYIGFDIGCRFTGSCDSCGFFGAVFANCKTANMQIDTGAFPVSALGLHGGYMESVAVSTCIPIHLKSGEIDGMQISGFQLSSSDAAVAAFECDVGAIGARGVVFSGCRFPQVVGASVTRPNSGSQFLFLYNQFFGSSSISTGAFAANATSIDALTNTSLSTRSLTISTATLPGDAILGQWFDLFTVNFAAGIGANSFVELDLPFAEVTALNKFVVAWTGTGAVFSNGGLLFTVYLHDVGFIRIRGTNITGVAIGPISGSMFVTVQKVLP